ncbi:FliM/FliN family flagellar motor switch protein [Agrobacterium larrymoorei]|uniref:Flagellar motor switch protein FliN n=1 Tax=Agrobacterium larrymoorei TaxID=160699 RepID=A0AAF0HBX2_9HYPH|nr:FliM/FliN family flagellar motor switch protein [Agrobacterium larrymoorei]WHA41451.1 FliM/FliN family flagellar motor switch protein [Agrobacterium larrymoorei]
MMDSKDDAHVPAWPAFGAAFSQPYSVSVAKDALTSKSRAVHEHLADWSDAPRSTSQALVGVQRDSGKSFDEIPLTMEVVIGQAQVPVSALMSLTPDQVILLNKRFGDPVEVRVNGQTIGRGEIVSDHNDNIIGVKLIEVIRA